MSVGSEGRVSALTTTSVFVPVMPLVHVIVNWLVPIAVMARLLTIDPGLTAMVVWLIGLPAAELVL